MSLQQILTSVIMNIIVDNSTDHAKPLSICELGMAVYIGHTHSSVSFFDRRMCQKSEILVSLPILTLEKPHSQRDFCFILEGLVKCMR